MPTRGPKPTPTALRLIAGNPQHRPLPQNEAKVAPEIGDPMPPGHLSDEAKVEWGRIIGTLVGARLMTPLDRAALAVCCQAYGRWVQAEKAVARMAEKDDLTQALMIRTKGGNAIQNPLVGTANRAAELYLKAAGEFGMTPSARARIDVGTGGGASLPATNAFARNGRRPT